MAEQRTTATSCKFCRHLGRECPVPKGGYHDNCFEELRPGETAIEVKRAYKPHAKPQERRSPTRDKITVLPEAGKPEKTRRRGKMDRLDLLEAEARRRGMSYGKLVASTEKWQRDLIAEGRAPHKRKEKVKEKRR